MASKMKIILISDIHANGFYFSTLLKYIMEEKADRIICLGDLVGYYDEPNEVINLCRDNNIECIQGNHEEYLLGELNYRKDKEDIYRIQVHKELLTINNKKFIEQMPKEIIINYQGVSMYCTHALPMNTSKYLYNPNDMSDDCIKGYDYYCSGHTHIPYIQYKYGTCIINPGSIGQPRDYTSMPSYAVVDIAKKEVTIKKVEVEKKTYISHLKDIKLNIELIEILTRKST